MKFGKIAKEEIPRRYLQMWYSKELEKQLSNLGDDEALQVIIEDKELLSATIRQYVKRKLPKYVCVVRDKVPYIFRR